jgi:hypothetical protein
MTDECCGSDLPDRTDTDDAEFNAAIEELAKHERRLLATLATPEAIAEFLADPRRVLRRLKIPIPAVVDHRMRLPNANRPGSLTVPPVVLPNGQIITPQVKVRITGRGR